MNNKQLTSDDLETLLQQFRATHIVQRRRFAGATWSYIVSGSGAETLLLLPGAPGIAEMAFRYIQAFEPHYRVIAPSYPATVRSIDQLLCGLDDLLNAETTGPIHLIGASYSGMVAQYLLSRNPEQVRTLLIGDTGTPRLRRALGYTAAVAVVSRMPRLFLHALLGTVLSVVLSGSSVHHHFWQRYFRAIVAALEVEELTNRVRVMIDMDRLGYTQRCKDSWVGPTLLLETTDDPLFSAVERAELRARFPNAELHLFHNRSHITALTRADEYIVLMSDFLARHRDQVTG